MSQLINWMLLSLALIAGTGAYVMLPPAMYAVVGLTALVYGFFTLRNSSATSLTSNIVFLTYVVFLLFNYMRDLDGPAAVSRLYINFFLGISVYCMIIRVFQLNSAVGASMFRYLPAASILVIVLGILLELSGVVISLERELGTGIEAAVLRPGGFMNPNMTAALSLIWLFAALESKPAHPLWMKTACLAGCSFIIAVTQSRGAMLFLAIYFLYKTFEGGGRNFKYYLLVLPFLAGLYTYSNLSGVADELYQANASRLLGDESSKERFLLLKTGFGVFMDSPVVGGGMRAMHHYFVSSAPNLIPGTHNEIIEWLVNFGMLGFFVMLLVFFRFYYVGSLKHLCLCILPSFLFSHNFFETTALQVALAYAYCLGVQAGRKHAANELGPLVVYWVAPGVEPVLLPRTQEQLWRQSEGALAPHDREKLHSFG